MKRVFCVSAGLAALTISSAAVASPVTPSMFGQAIADAKSAMMTDPADAYRKAAHAGELADKLIPADPLAAPTAEWLQGEALARQNMAGRARPILDHALQTVTHVAPRDKLRGNLLLSRGWIKESGGEIAAGLKDFQKAYRLLAAAGEARAEARALQNIAGIYQDAGDNNRSLRYYSQASDVYRGDPAFSVAADNNVAETLKQLGRFEEAERQYRRALAAANNLKSAQLEASVLTNLATIRLLRGDAAEAQRLANLALEKSAEPDAAEERPFAWGVLAQIAARRGDLQLAARLIGQTFAGADLQTTPIAYRDFHKLASDIYAKIGDAERALVHLQAYKRLDDSVRTLAASTNAALMAAQFDFSNQNLRIVQLKANRAKLHELLLGLAVAAVSLIVLVLSIAIFFLRRSRNAVRAANGELSGANLSLEKALRAKSDFLAMTSHEIRTPLNGILGMTQIMLADRHVPPPLRSKIEVVHGAGETMRALVDDILDLSKMETGALAVHRTPMRLHRLLRDAAILWQSKAHTKGLQLDLEIKDCPDLIEEDEDRLRQILFNLMSNAVKFTETGFVRLSAEALDGNILILTVADSGIGIAEEQHALIFEKFQQADASTSRKYGGSGLGLAICRNLADALSGKIRLESAVGTGSTFSLIVPLRPLADSELEHKDSDATIASSDTILMLEPNPLVQRVIGKKLSAAVNAVTFVASSEDLLAKLASDRPRIVLVQANALRRDHRSGQQALQALIPEVRGIDARLALLVTEEDGLSHADLADVDLVIRKPVGGDQLLEKVLQMLAAPRSPAALASAA